MHIGKRIGLSDEAGVAVAVFAALIIVAFCIAGYYLIYRPQPEPYNSIYILDANKQTTDYAHTLIHNQNSTFSVYVGVENHMGGTGTRNYEVQTKITQTYSGSPTNATPVDTYDVTLADGETDLHQVTVTLNTPGSYTVVFELYRVGDEGVLDFRGYNYCLLDIEVI
ncbi:MAG: DUF1616 domain-containing protein [Candidatus Bathyarchaeota archaeon]|nr:DUF1616 domain-containing protein [Candidatus Bathyarchaeota archaeon]